MLDDDRKPPSSADEDGTGEEEYSWKFKGLEVINTFQCLFRVPLPLMNTNVLRRIPTSGIRVQRGQRSWASNLPLARAPSSSVGIKRLQYSEDRNNQ